MGTYRKILIGIATLSFMFSAIVADNVTDAVFQAAQIRYDMLYSDHNKFIAEGHSVARGQIGSAHFYRDGISQLEVKVNNISLVAAIACALGCRMNYASLGYNLTNYQKTERFCDALDSHVELEKKCNIYTNYGVCDAKNVYRTINGYCNNLKNPKWGAQLTPYGRLIAANFDDGGRNPRQSVYNYQSLPKPRYIGNAIYYNAATTVQSKSNYFAILFGQFIAHDYGERLYYQIDNGGPDFQACSADNSYILPPEESAFGTVAIEIPANDSYLSRYNVGCLDFVRSQPIFRNDCKFSAAEFGNARTHWLDSSNIYGSVPDVAASLRQFQNGKLKMNSKNILPQRANDGTCDYDCYYTAEIRAPPFYTLAVIHSVLFRLHNQFADELQRLQPNWNDEKLYQESRRIVIAVYQNIVYNEWIPTLFGSDFAAKYSLNSQGVSECGTYSESVDPSASNEFSHAAFRQFHKTIPEKFNFYDASMKAYKTVPLYETDNGPAILEKEYNAVLRGLINDPNIGGPSSFSDTMRNKIFDNFNPRKLGMDMPSNDILVGRDQGVSPYHMYLEKFFGIKVNKWEDLLITISQQNINKLKTLYAGVQDLDAFVGLSLETLDYVNYKYVGPVGKHILGEQFNRSKFGDRFFYCLKNNGNPFTMSQLAEINQWTLGRLLCKTTDIQNMLPKAFETPGVLNYWTSCKLFKDINLNAWK